MASKTVVITGGNSGLGYECAKTIAASSTDWHVVIASRNEAKAADAVGALREQTGNRCIEALRLDLGSLASVRAFAATLSARDDLPPIGALVANAGIQTISGLTFSEDGFETTFAVNHLGHFLLVNLLLDRLASPARVVVVASDTHDPRRRTGMPNPLYVDARTLAHPPADGSDETNSPTAGRRRYTTSKLCNVLFTYELARRVAERPITVNAFNPGLMPGSGLAQDFSPLMRFGWKYLMPALRLLPGVHSTAASGRALARLVLDPGLENVSGRYFEGKGPVDSSEDSHDPAMAPDLWETSAQLAGLVSDQP